MLTPVQAEVSAPIHSGEAASAPRGAVSLILLTLRVLLAGALLVAAGYYVDAARHHEDYGREAAFVLITGLAFGIVLQRSRFCFLCNLRDLFWKKDSRGTLGIVAALIIGTLGYFVVFDAWIPEPVGMKGLPPNAHVGPVSWALLAGGALFGIGAGLSGSCISGHLYRLGEGSTSSPLALAGAGVGLGLGFLSWNTIYLRIIQESPVVWLPSKYGYGWAAAFNLVILALLGALLLRWWRPTEPAAASTPRFRAALRGFFVTRWPAWVGGILVGAIGAAAYLRTEPLGVTAELGRLSRKIWTPVLPERLEGLDSYSGCSTADVTGGPLFTHNALFVIALVAGAFAAALLANQFRPKLEKWPAYLLAPVGGVLLGFGSILSLGCTIGTLLSGISATALSGWVFLLGLLPGVLAGLWLRAKAGC